MHTVTTDSPNKFHDAMYDRFISATCVVKRKEMRKTLWRNFKTNTTNRFLDLKNPLLETEIIFLRGLDQKLWQKMCLWVMAENVSSARTSHVRVAQNIFT